MSFERLKRFSAERLMHEHTETVETVETVCVTDGHRAKAIAES
jgi:hypothetical protein